MSLEIEFLAFYFLFFTVSNFNVDIHNHSTACKQHFRSMASHYYLFQTCLVFSVALLVSGVEVFWYPGKWGPYWCLIWANEDHNKRISTGLATWSCYGLYIGHLKKKTNCSQTQWEYVCEGGDAFLKLKCLK